MTTFLRYFLSSLFAHLYYLPWYPVFWCRWLAEEFPMSAHSLGSSNDGPLRFPFSNSYPHVQLGLVRKWAFFHPRIGLMCSILRSDPILPHYVFSIFWKFCKHRQYKKKMYFNSGFVLRSYTNSHFVMTHKLVSNRDFDLSCTKFYHFLIASFFWYYKLMVLYYRCINGFFFFFW